MSQMGRLRNGRTRRAEAFRREPGATMIQPAGHRCDLRRYTRLRSTAPGAGIEWGWGRANSTPLVLAWLGSTRPFV
jgi:hypothetical protein